MLTNDQADKLLIESLYKKISELQNENIGLQTVISKYERQTKQLAYSPTPRQLAAMQNIINANTKES
jgi:hypothetical protein